MQGRRIGFILGAAALALACVLPVPAGQSREALITAGLVVLMATWWMTEALPLTATALMPFLVLPFAGVMSAKDTAGAYYSDILFLLLGGAFIALAIERTGLHRRLALGILRLTGARVGPWGLLLAFMGAAGLLSMLISNTSTALIMMPMALAVLQGGGAGEEERGGLSGGGRVAQGVLDGIAALELAGRQQGGARDGDQGEDTTHQPATRLTIRSGTTITLRTLRLLAAR